MTDEASNPATEAPAESRKKPRGGRPRTKAKISAALLLDTPEMQALFQKAVAEKVEALFGQLALKRNVEEGTEAPTALGDRELIRSLALAIAEVGDQGAKMKRVAPAELEERQKARERMENLILEARARHNDLLAQGDEDGAGRAIPRYELLRAVHFDEQIVQPTWIGADHIQHVQEIEWPGIPNEAMRPSNDAARGIHEAFMRSIGGRTAPAGQNRPKRLPMTERHFDGLRVIKPGQTPEEAAQVGNIGRNARMAQDGGLRVLRGRQPGEVVETNVLGTLAAPARQLA